MLMNGRRDLGRIGSYQAHAEPMQIISGSEYNPTIHYEERPSDQVAKEMTVFFGWFSDTSPEGENPLPVVVRAAIAHLWFESIHPFEDSNGRIGRAIAEKALAQGFSAPTMTVLAKVLLKRRKEYYTQINKASKSLQITDWILWFAAAAIEAQRNTLAYVNFIVHKTKFSDRCRGQLNVRQEKVLQRMLQEGPDGFTGGLSASNYMRITGAGSATTTRDLQDLVIKKALQRTGALKSTRYFLAIDLKPVERVGVDDIQ